MKGASSTANDRKKRSKGRKRALIKSIDLLGLDCRRFTRELHKLANGMANHAQILVQHHMLMTSRMRQLTELRKQASMQASEAGAQMIGKSPHEMGDQPKEERETEHKSPQKMEKEPEKQSGEVIDPTSGVQSNEAELAEKASTEVVKSPNEKVPQEPEKIPHHIEVEKSPHQNESPQIEQLGPESSQWQPSDQQVRQIDQPSPNSSQVDPNSPQIDQPGPHPNLPQTQPHNSSPVSVSQTTSRQATPRLTRSKAHSALLNPSDTPNTSTSEFLPSVPITTANSSIPGIVSYPPSTFKANVGAFASSAPVSNVVLVQPAESAYATRASTSPTEALPMVSSGSPAKVTVLPNNIAFLEHPSLSEDMPREPIPQRARYERGRHFKYKQPGYVLEYHGDEDELYKPEYTKYKKDAGPAIDGVFEDPGSFSRKALCPYCYDIKFFRMKNANYADHLALVHGIMPGSCIVPDPFKAPDSVKTSSSQKGPQMLCPVCAESMPLKSGTQGSHSYYLKHFRYEHYKTPSNAVSEKDRFQRLKVRWTWTPSNSAQVAESQQ